MKLLIKSLCLLLVLMVVTVCNPVIDYIPKAEALKTVYDPRNHSQNLSTKLEAIKQTAYQAQQVQHQLANLAKLNPAYQDKTLQEIRSCISSINDIRSSCNAIGTDFNSMMTNFGELSPDYEDWNGASADRYSRQMDKVRAAWEEALNQSLLSQTGASPDLQASTSQKVEELVKAAHNAQGTTGAVQALAQLNALQIAELQKMLAITTDAQRTQNMFFKHQIELEEQGKARRANFIKNTENDMKENVKIQSKGEGLHQFQE